MAKSQLRNSECYQEFSTDPFNDYQLIITKSLNEMLSNNLIDKEIMGVLKPRNAKPVRFYLLPKYIRRTSPVDLLSH